MVLALALSLGQLSAQPTIFARSCDRLPFIANPVSLIHKAHEFKNSLFQVANAFSDARFMSEWSSDSERVDVFAVKAADPANAQNPSTYTFTATKVVQSPGRGRIIKDAVILFNGGDANLPGFIKSHFGFQTNFNVNFETDGRSCGKLKEDFSFFYNNKQGKFAESLKN